jgi:hypothetical protein
MFVKARPLQTPSISMEGSERSSEGVTYHKKQHVTHRNG